MQIIKIRGIPPKILTSYLSHRQPCVRIGNKISTMGAVDQGETQDIILALTEKIKIFADDAVIFYDAEYWLQLKQIVGEELVTIFNHPEERNNKY